MLDRRSSARLVLDKVAVREMNGDYLYSFHAHDLSEESIFLENKLCVGNLEPFSKLTFTLPNGKQLHNITARIVRECRKGDRIGCAYEFMNLSEDVRMELKRVLLELAA